MNKKNLFFLFLVLLWMVLIFCLSNMSSIESNKRSKEIVNQIVDNSSSITVINNNTIKNDNYNVIFRKCAHVFMYTVLCILVLILIYNLFKNIGYKYYFIAFIICFLYACIDEIHQLFVNGRTGQFLDVLIDSIGIIIGLITTVLFRMTKRVRNF